MKPYYEDSAVTIYHGDCRDILLKQPKSDLVLTDPPYGISVDKQMHEKSGQQYGNAAAPKSFYPPSNWDSKPAPLGLIHIIISHATNAIVWGGNYYELPPARCVLVWDKQNGDNHFADAELAWTNLDKPVRVKRHLWNGMLRKDGEIRLGHPTQKPLEVMTWCILQSPETVKTIVDPFMGSGTTLRAAKDLGRKAIGIEIEEKYWVVYHSHNFNGCGCLTGQAYCRRSEKALEGQKSRSSAAREGNRRFGNSRQRQKPRRCRAWSFRRA